MNLYFLLINGKYISKKSKLGFDTWKIETTFDINEARYWDNEQVVKCLNTQLHNRKFKSYICRAKVELEQIFGEIV